MPLGLFCLFFVFNVKHFCGEKGIVSSNISLFTKHSQISFKINLNVTVMPSSKLILRSLKEKRLLLSSGLKRKDYRLDKSTIHIISRGTYL